MNTRDIVLVVSGAVVGYLLVGFISKPKDKAEVLIDSAQTDVDQVKIDKCNEEVALLLQSAKFATTEAQEAFKKEAFESCMAKNG